VLFFWSTIWLLPAILKCFNFALLFLPLLVFFDRNKIQICNATLNIRYTWWYTTLTLIIQTVRNLSFWWSFDKRDNKKLVMSWLSMLQQKWKLQIQLNVVMMNTSTEVANFHLRLNYRLLFPSKFSCKILKKKQKSTKHLFEKCLSCTQRWK